MAYHNSLMVQIWSAVASKDARLLELALSRFKALPTNTAWAIYLRCHDDIGWAIDDSDAHLTGVNGHDPRMFLADYFTGKFYGSTALGVDFQIDPASGERRTSGSAASLAGIEHAVENADLVALGKAIDRYICAYAMVFGFGGIPLIYMGDEIGMFNDISYQKDSAKVEDNRWIHRPAMNWEVALRAAQKKTDGSVAQMVRRRMQNLIETRRRLPSLHASVASKVRAGRGVGVAIVERHHSYGDLIQVYNLSDANRWVSTDELGGLRGKVRDELTGSVFDLDSGISLNSYQMLWLTQANE
jgi:amylosucrase